MIHFKKGLAIKSTLMQHYNTLMHSGSGGGSCPWLLPAYPPTAPYSPWLRLPKRQGIFGFASAALMSLVLGWPGAAWYVAGSCPHWPGGCSALLAGDVCREPAELPAAKGGRSSMLRLFFLLSRSSSS